MGSLPLFLVLLHSVAVAIDGSYYKCSQGTYECSCTPTDQQTPYTDWKECDHECCPLWNCDPNAHQCQLDLAGGNSRQSCAESCGIDKNGYTCEFDSSGLGTCQPTLLSYQSQKSCEIVCGTNTVILCVYKCGLTYYQRCKSILPGESNVCWNQDMDLEALAPSPNHAAGGADTGNCMAEGASCLWAPCCGTLACDPNNKFCSDGSPAPTPSVLYCPGTGAPAEFVGPALSMQGLQQCMNYDCDWSEGPKKPCKGITNCPEQGDAAPCPSQTQKSTPRFAGTEKSRIVSRPASVQYMGIPELAPPRGHLLGSTKGASIKHTVNYTHPTTGKVFRATYDTKLTSMHEVVSVDQEEGIEALACTKGADGLMTLYLGTDQATRAAFIERMHGLPILTASPVWKCLFDDYASRNNTRTVALRRVTKVVFVAPGHEYLVVSTVASKYEEIIQEAHVSMQTTAFPEPVHINAETEHTPLRKIHRQYAAETAVKGGKRGERKVGGFFSFIGNLISSAWSMVKRLAEAVAKAAEALKNAIEAFITGDFDWDKKISLASITYNYDKTNQGAKQKNIQLANNVVCTECYTDLEVTLNFDFSMSDYSVKHAGCFIEGNLVHHVEMTSKQSSVVKDLTFDKVLDILHFPDIHFQLGPVPISITTTVPVHGGLTLEYAEADVAIHAHAHVTGHAKYGMQWTQEKGFQFIHEHSLAHDGAVSAEGATSAAVLVYVMPVVWINVDHIGGPNVGVKGFVEPGVDYESTGSQCSKSGGGGASYIVNFGLQLTIGAHLDIEFVGHTFLNKTFEPAVIWSHKWPLASGCFDVAAQGSNFSSRAPGAGLEPYRMFDAVAYNGPVVVKNISGCDVYHSVHVSAQFVQTDDGHVLFGVGPNDNFIRQPAWPDLGPYNIGCLGQMWYLLAFGKLAPYSPPAGAPLIQYLNCTLDSFKDGYTYTQVGGDASFSDDLGTLTIDTKSRCFEPIVLERERRPGSARRAGEFDIVWP